MSGAGPGLIPARANWRFRQRGRVRTPCPRLASRACASFRAASAAHVWNLHRREALVKGLAPACGLRHDGRVELLLGCGADRIKRFTTKDGGVAQWKRLVTADIEARHRPDIVLDAERGLPFRDNTFDEIHAYEVLEHCTGQQGDAPAFFRVFSDLWRVLRPGGLLMATVPRYDSEWAWGDPSHKRVITHGTLSFLSQAAYKRGVGTTCMSDFRSIYSADFEARHAEIVGESFVFCLQAIKGA